MTAYVIFIRERTLDQGEMDIYAELVPATLPRVPIQMLAAYGRLEVLEGDAPEGLVLFSFPTVEDATAWYHSDAYQSAARHRHAGATYRGFVVEGVA
ncbi:uncharacterized protein (DUF1330 family) [Xanthomonas arboricola]|uniref:DUF1330 domain-containing protein n=1 Tax=Xanthomonas arboricola TaxID=56448 RepID=UPI000CEF1E66|nr:DUF1330 domain-containing protein [Xanthomonas arboricola]NJC30492.1 uncharacterized protein (DUF1330 family) [Xanthomonas arboricola]PPU33735.1 hypothetical protein XarbCFBP7604_07425 [Xanthomonas arboricola]